MKRKRILLLSVGLLLLSVTGVWASQAENTPITVDNAAQVRQLALLEGHTGPVFTLAFNPDGTTLASGGSAQDFTVRLWDVATGGENAVLEGHTAQIAALSFNADGTEVESASYDGTIRLWDAANGTAIDTIGSTSDGAAIGVNNLMTFFSADGSRLVYMSEGGSGIDALDMTTHDLTTPVGSDSALADLFTAPGVGHLSADGKWFVLETVDTGPVHLIDLETGTEVKTLARTDPDSYYYTAIAISPDGKWLAAVDDTSAIIEVWNLETGEALPNITALKPAADDVTLGVYGLAFNPDGTLLATASYDATVRIFDVADGSELVSLPTSDIGGAGVVAWSPDGSRLASGNVDGTVQIWGVGR